MNYPEFAKAMGELINAYDLDQKCGLLGVSLKTMRRWQAGAVLPRKGIWIRFRARTLGLAKENKNECHRQLDHLTSVIEKHRRGVSHVQVLTPDIKNPESHTAAGSTRTHSVRGSVVNRNWTEASLLERGTPPADQQVGSQQIRLVRPGATTRADIYYVGSFDDDILLSGERVIDLEVINETLSQAVLYGAPVLINDGYLLHYPAGLKALIDPEVSPLLDLLDCHYVRLYSRNSGQLAEMPEKMSKRIPSYERVVKERGWDQIKASLEQLSAHLIDIGGIEFWPNVHTGSGFKRLVNLVFERLDRASFGEHLSVKQADAIHREFNATIDGNADVPARTAWKETYQRSDFGLSDVAKDFLLWVGIEAYHYNHAMTSCLNDPQRQVGVVTRFSDLFTELRVPLRATGPDGGGPSSIPKLMFPPDISQEMLHRGSLLREIATPGTELHERKDAYLSAYSAILTNRDASVVASEAARAYSLSIARFLSVANPNSRAVEGRTLLGICIDLLGGAAGGAVMGAASHGFRGFVDGAFIGTAQVLQGLVGGGLVKSRGCTSLRSAAPLVADLFESSEPENDLPLLTKPLGNSEWFAFLSVLPEAAKEHGKHMPEHKFR